MPGIRVKDNDSQEVIIRRFKRACEKAGVVAEARRRERFEKPTAVRKRKKAAAVKRDLKRQFRDRPHPSSHKRMPANPYYHESE